MHHGQPPGPIVVESRSAAGRPTHAGRLGRYSVAGRSSQCASSRASRPAPRRSSSPRPTTCNCGPARVIRSTACCRKLSPWSARRPSGPIGQRQFDVQIVGGIAIHHRCIAELETGEGKTLVSTMPAFLNALTGKGVHIVTVNDYLARRDAEWMGPIYRTLGLTVGCIQTGQTDPVRRAAYACDITYGTAKELGFDFLRDELKRLQLGGDAHRKTFEQVYLGQGGARRVADAGAAHPSLRDRRRGRQHPDRRGANAADHRGEQSADAGRGCRLLRSRQARRRRWSASRTTSTIRSSERPSLSAAGRRKIQAVAANPAFVSLTVDGLYEYVERSLRAQIAYLKDRDYVAVDGEIVIVDEFTGRMMPGRQWQDGLHQAIQAKEKLEITLETITAARVTVQDFFKRYTKLAGMTGTASSDAAELRRIYKVGVFKVPTNRPCQRVWLPDRVFSTIDEGFQAVANQIVEWNKQGVPVLVGTRSIEKSERLSALARGAGDRAPDLERQEPRDRGPDRLTGRSERPGDGRHQHGRPRNRHQAGRWSRRAGRAARHRHRTA